MWISDGSQQAREVVTEQWDMCLFCLQNHHSAARGVDPVAVGGEELTGLRDTYRANLLRTW